MNPESKARQNIDRQLAQCGWAVQDAKEINISAGPGVAVREVQMKPGPADYLLYVDARAIGIIEAKKEGHTLKGVEKQSMDYLNGLPDGFPAHGKPLPFHYESTGKVTQFTNLLDPFPRSRDVFTFHRPEELRRLVSLEGQLRANLREMPPLNTEGLWPVQVRAIQNLEQCLADNKPRSLIQMAMGSGKTFTACSFSYRLIKFAKAKRILFLVDRKNLGRQTLNEFQQYVSPYTNYKFSEEYPVQLLTKNAIDPAAHVCITTIQRLYAALKGEEEFDEANEEGSMFETVSDSLFKEPLPVVYNKKIPIETFDFIVIDECHRSIYNLWRQVLEYFDAFLIGLTATPSKQTIGFFFNNLVMEYDHSDAVIDGVNVGFEVYRIATRISGSGATLEAEPGFFVPRRDRRTREVQHAELDSDLTYTAKQLDRDVVSENQIRLVVRTFKERLFTHIFPGRKEVPKTLVFAKDDSHADDITRIIREEFNRGNDFCQKITYRTKGKPEDLLAEFRNSFNPRIAVSVDMISTGTDVKPLECLLFMRNVKSASYFEQMKGRGCRVISLDDLKAVTPDADTKCRFVIVDAIGVCCSEKADSKPMDRQRTVSLEKILEHVGRGVATYDVASTLTARLVRLDRELPDDVKDEITEIAEGVTLSDLAHQIKDAIDPDKQDKQARQNFQLTDDEKPTESQLNQVEQEMISEALRPFHKPQLRNKIVNAKRILEQVIDQVTPDELLEAGFDEVAQEQAQAMVASFRRFIDENKDELDAIKLFYSRPYRAGLTYKHLKQLAAKLSEPPVSATPDRLWQAFRIIEPNSVKGQWNKLVDVIALVRHAIDPDEAIVPFSQSVSERFDEWLAEQQAAGREFTPEQIYWLQAIRDHIATSLCIEQDDFYDAPFAQLGGLGKAHELFGDDLASILDELNVRLAA